jgi:hypothetical protein
MTEKPMQRLLLSLATLPTLGLIFAARSATATALTLGRWSEELVRGDRLPVQDDATQPVTPSETLNAGSD